jgi:Plant transposon protein
MCLEVGRQFNTLVADLYQDEYLHVPDAKDLKAICNLHKEAHGVNGMVGSLDCSHTYWKNCPKAWQGSFQGKEGKVSRSNKARKQVAIVQHKDQEEELKHGAGVLSSNYYEVLQQDESKEMLRKSKKRMQKNQKNQKR